MNFPIAILAGGLATRLRPLTEKVPKATLDVAGKPFIVWQLELLKRNGFHKAVLCVGHLGEMVRDVVGDGTRWGIEVSYSFDGERLLGTGGAVKKALPLLDEAFFVMYGDSYLDCDYESIETAFVAGGKQALMTVIRNDNRWDRSNVLYRDNRIVAYDKIEPTAEMHHIDYGLGVFAARSFEACPDSAAIDLADVYRALLREHQLGGYEVAERFYEIGSAEGLEEARGYFMRKEGVG